MENTITEKEFVEMLQEMDKLVEEGKANAAKMTEEEKNKLYMQFIKDSKGGKNGK